MGYNEIIVVGIKQLLVLRGKIGMFSQHQNKGLFAEKKIRNKFISQFTD